MKSSGIILLVIASTITQSFGYSGGSGTPDDPYQIATAEDLILLGETPDDYDKYFILTADIDLDPNLPGRKVFDRAVISPDVNDTESGFQGPRFMGVFDGNGHAISYLKIRGGGYLGLFGQFGPGAGISNLGVQAVDINGTAGYIGGLIGSVDAWDGADAILTDCHSTGMVNGSGYVGGLVGSNSYGRITSCYSTVMISGKGWHVGGLVGENSGSISASYTAGVVTGDTYVGGLVGDGLGDITQSYSIGTVIGDSYVGGLIGRSLGVIAVSYSTGMVAGEGAVGGLVGYCGGYDMWQSWPIRSKILDCYSTGVVTGDHAVGGLVGILESSQITMSYSIGVVTGNEDVGGLVGTFREHRFKPSETMASFWDIQASGQTTSTGGMGLTTSEMQNASIFLEAGWDFVGETVNGPNDVWTIVEGHTYPLLAWQKYGGGTGEPNDPYLIYTAEHLNSLGAEPNDYAKCFRLMADIDLSAYVYDRAVIAPDTGGERDPWTHVAANERAFTGLFDGNSFKITNLRIVGDNSLGLLGILAEGAEVCSLGIVNANVTGGLETGALACFNRMGTITKCYSSGTVSGRGTTGGLVAWNAGEVSASYSVATVSGDRQAGGLVGVNSGSISECYSRGSVFGGNEMYSSVAGLVAVNRLGNPYGGGIGPNGTIFNCYSTGVVTGGFYIDGCVGTPDGWPTEGITSCFWDIDASGILHSINGVGLSTVEMQTASTFLDAGWDFAGETVNGPNDVWTIVEGQTYPLLSWQKYGGGTGEPNNPYL